MADRSTCLSPYCGISVEGEATKCPQCGWMMRSPRNTRMRGRVLIGLGLFLVLLMGTIAWTILPSMLQPGVETAGGTFTGTVWQAVLVLGVIFIVALFGAFSIAAGLHMTGTGRPNRRLAYLVLVIATALIVIGSAAEVIVELI